MVEAHDNQNVELVMKPSRRGRWIKGAAAFTVLALGFGLKPDGHHATALADSAPKSDVIDDAKARPETESPQPTDSVAEDAATEDTQVPYESEEAQEQLSSRVYIGFLYDKYVRNAQIWAEQGVPEECEAWVAKLAEISIGPVSFDCTL